MGEEDATYSLEVETFEDWSSLRGAYQRTLRDRCHINSYQVLHGVDKEWMKSNTIDCIHRFKLTSEDPRPTHTHKLKPFMSKLVLLDHTSFLAKVATFALGGHLQAL